MNNQSLVVLSTGTGASGQMFIARCVDGEGGAAERGGPGISSQAGQKTEVLLRGVDIQ